MYGDTRDYNWGDAPQAMLLEAICDFYDCQNFMRINELIFYDLQKFEWALYKAQKKIDTSEIAR